MSPTVEWVVGIAAGLTALGVIWAKGVRPLWRGLRRVHHAVHCITEAGPVLRDIAVDFKTDGGGSLRDSIEEIKARQLTEEAERAQIAVRLAQEVKDVAEALAVRVESSAAVLDAKFTNLSDKMIEHIGNDVASFAESSAAFARIEAHQANTIKAREAAAEVAAAILRGGTPPPPPPPDVP